MNSNSLISTEIVETILIVDDNIANLEIARTILSDFGYEVIIASSADESLEILRYEKPDLILLDIMMPSINGFELCKILKTNDEIKDIPIIFLTALTQPEDLVMGFELGGADYITKPFSRDVLLTRVKNQLELVKKNRIIIQQNRDLIKLNNEKNALLAIAAHDLKNPLQAILGSSELIARKVLNEKIDISSELIENIKFSSKKAINIIIDLLDVQAMEEGKLALKMELIDARDIVIESIDEFLPIANKKRVKLNYEEDDNICRIFTDKNKLSRVVDNLISNAIKFSSSGTEVKITCMNVNIGNKNEIIRIEVCDQGPGFTKEDLQSIYSKFSKLSARPTAEESSTGLGLSIVKKMTELLGGIVELETKVGVGSKFKLSFFKA